MEAFATGLPFSSTTRPSSFCTSAAPAGLAKNNNIKLIEMSNSMVTFHSIGLTTQFEYIAVPIPNPRSSKRTSRCRIRKTPATRVELGHAELTTALAADFAQQLLHPLPRIPPPLEMDREVLGQ